MIKIAIINSSFQQEFFRTRWEEFAKTYKDVHVYLIAPKKYTWGVSRTLTYGKSFTIEIDDFDHDNLHLRTVKHTDCITNGWKSNDFKAVLKSIQPDIIYHIGSHTQNPLFQIINIKKRFFKKKKLIAFSMRGVNTNKMSRLTLMKQDKNIIRKLLRIPMFFLDLNRLCRFNKHVDVVTCHYPDAKELFEKEGFRRLISVQTQVGVDTNVFYPNEEYRREIREKYNLGNSFVFGSASRFHYSKGILQILESLTFEGDWKYLLMGSGLDDEIQEIKNKIIELHLEDKVIMTGYIDTSEMPKYWNAIDCAIHFPLSTPKWIETFSLALVQAMATRRPVVGSSSGSVPFQIGPSGCIVEEGNSLELSKTLERMMNDESYRKQNADAMYERSTTQFSAKSLNRQFYDLINEIVEE